MSDGLVRALFESKGWRYKNVGGTTYVRMPATGEWIKYAPLDDEEPRQSGD